MFFHIYKFVFIAGNRMNNSAYNTQGHTHAQIYENRQHVSDKIENIE